MRAECPGEAHGRGDRARLDRDPDRLFRVVGRNHHHFAEIGNGQALDERTVYTGARSDSRPGGRVNKSKDQPGTLALSNRSHSARICCRTSTI